MDLLITLVLIGMLIFFLPYIIAGAMILIALIGAFLALVYAGISDLFGR
jgi:hypothetical protein